MGTATATANDVTRQLTDFETTVKQFAAYFALRAVTPDDLVRTMIKDGLGPVDGVGKKIFEVKKDLEDKALVFTEPVKPEGFSVRVQSKPDAMYLTIFINNQRQCASKIGLTFAPPEIKDIPSMKLWADPKSVPIKFAVDAQTDYDPKCHRGDLFKLTPLLEAAIGCLKELTSEHGTMDFVKA